MIGTHVFLPDLRIRCVACSPLILGMFMSMKMMSYCEESHILIPSSPSKAWCTLGGRSHNWKVTIECARNARNERVRTSKYVTFKCAQMDVLCS